MWTYAVTHNHHGIVAVIRAHSLSEAMGKWIKQFDSGEVKGCISPEDDGLAIVTARHFDDVDKFNIYEMPEYGGMGVYFA